MRAVDGNSPCAFRGISRRVDVPATRLRAIKQARRHAQRFSAYGFDANGIKDVQAGLASIQRGNVGRAIEIAERIFARIDRSGLETKGPAMRDPTRERGAQIRAQIFTHVEITHSRSTT